jgi:regulator of nonsense transcripts 1
MGDQEDLFEHLEGASALDTPSEYSFSHGSTVGGSINGSAHSKAVGNGDHRRTAADNRLDLDLDLDLTALNSLDLEGSSLDLHNEATGRKGKEGGNGHTSSNYAGGILDDAYDFEGEAAEDLPAHACAYCGIHNAGCVVKCLICNKW